MRRHISARPTISKNIVRPLSCLVPSMAEQRSWLPVLSPGLAHGSFVPSEPCVRGGFVRGFWSLSLQCLTYEDCMLLPKGEKIAKLLKIPKKTKQKPWRKRANYDKFTSKDRCEFGPLIFSGLVEVLRAPAAAHGTRRPIFHPGEISWKKAHEACEGSIWTILRIRAEEIPRCAASGAVSGHQARRRSGST